MSVHCPPSPPPPIDAIGRRAALPAQIGKYRVLGRLGDGATSEVFLGYDDFQGRDVAIKRVRASTAGDPIDGHYSERFFAAEAALVGRLQHPNVVQIFDAVADPVGALPGDGVRAPAARCARTAAPTSCCRSS